jgi:hypothetical protein
MPTSRGFFCSCVILLLALGFLSSSWGMSPRYMLMGRAHLVAVEAPNLLKLRMLDQDRVVTVRLLGVGSPRNRDRIKGLDHEVLSYIRRNEIWESSRGFVRSLLDGKVAEVWTRKWDRYDGKNRLHEIVAIENNDIRNRRQRCRRYHLWRRAFVPAVLICKKAK